MTELLEAAVRSARDLSPDMQDEIARLIMSFVEREDVVELSAEDETAVSISREAASRGAFATDEQMRAVRAKYSS